MKKIKKNIVYIFVGLVTILALIATFAVWDVFAEDVMWKAISNIGIFTFALIIIFVAFGVVDTKDTPSSSKLHQPVDSAQPTDKAPAEDPLTPPSPPSSD